MSCGRRAGHNFFNVSLDIMETAALEFTSILWGTPFNRTLAQNICAPKLTFGAVHNKYKKIFLEIKTDEETVTQELSVVIQKISK